MLQCVYMDKTNKDLYDYEIKRYARKIESLRRKQSRAHKFNFVKRYIIERNILKETKQHFQILDRITLS